MTALVTSRGQYNDTIQATPIGRIIEFESGSRYLRLSKTLALRIEKSSVVDVINTESFPNTFGHILHEGTIIIITT